MSTTLQRSSVDEQDAHSRSLADDQLQHLEERGFVTIPPIAAPAELLVIGNTLRKLFERSVGFNEGARRDLVDPADDLSANKLTELVWPHRYAPSLHKTGHFRNALSIARQVLGPDATFAFDHAILKPSFHGAETPWHQDEAYQAGPDRGRQQIAIWMPTSDVTVDNGCMRYIPYSQKLGVLAHQPLNGDERIHALECIGHFSPADAAYCPLPAGGAVIHLGRTLHSAGPNRTALPRLAYILVFSGPPRLQAAPRDFAWLARRNETAGLRRQHWLRRGGAFIEFARRAKRARAYKVAVYVRKLARAVRRSG